MNGERYTSADIEAATAGLCDPYTVNNWLKRDLLWTQVPPTVRGRSRRFSRENVVEFMWLARLRAAGLELTAAKELIFGRCHHQSGEMGGFKGETVLNEFSKLPEIANATGEPLFWVIHYEPGQYRSKTARPWVVDVKVAPGKTTVAEASYLAGVERSAAATIIFPASELVRQVEEILAQRLRDREAKG